MSTDTKRHLVSISLTFAVAFFTTLSATNGDITSSVVYSAILAGLRSCSKVVVEYFIKKGGDSLTSG